MKASDIKPGDRIVLDMGYGGREMDETCTVTRTTLGKSFFGHPVIRIQVKRYTGELINVVDFLPDDKVYLPKESS